MMENKHEFLKWEMKKMNNYENAIEKLSENALNAITVTQEYADSIEEPIIMFSLEAAHSTVAYGTRQGTGV